MSDSTKNIQGVLQDCEFFKGLDKVEIGKLARLCAVEKYDIGEYVFRQGDFGEHIYVVSEGRLMLERTVDLGSRKGNVVIGLLGKGRVLGCWSTLLGEAHILMSSAVGEKPTKVIVMRGSELRRMMIENTVFGFTVMERLCFLLRDRIQDAYGALEKI